MNIKISAMALAAAGLLFGCAQGAAPTLNTVNNPAPDTVVDADDGANSGGSGGSTGLFVRSYEYDTDFKFYVWSGTFTTANDSDGGLKCIAGGGGWAGGSFANVSSDTSATFSMSNVAKIKFKIKANIPGNQVNYILGCTGYEYKKTLADLGYSSLSSTSWTSVEIDLSGQIPGHVVESAFSFVMSDDAGDLIAAGEWISVRDIDWVDASGNSVDITP